MILAVVGNVHRADAVLLHAHAEIVEPAEYRPLRAPSLFRQYKRISTQDYRDAARTTAVVSFAICFIFGVGCSWRGAVANGGSWGGCVDNAGSCGVVLKLSNRSLARSLEYAFSSVSVLGFWA